MTFCLRAGNGPVAQRSEQATHNRSVVGSTPTGPTYLTRVIDASVRSVPTRGDAMADAWSSADAYDVYIGRWSRLVAGEFVGWLDVPAGRRWLDVGCGTGALTAAILEHGDPSEVLGVDPSEHYVASAAATVIDPRVRFKVADAAHVPVAVADIVVSGLSLNFVPDLSAALEAMRAAAPGGVIAAYVWDYAGKMELIRYFWDAAVELDPSAADFDEGARFPICRHDLLVELWDAVGLRDVHARAIDVPTIFPDFDAYWTPFLGGQGPAPGYVMALDERRRRDLHDRLRAALPAQPDGSIHLVARAWAIRGTS